LTLYRITNLLSTNLIIEDLGITLSAGESRNISADAHARSESLRRQQKYLKIETMYVVPPPSGSVPNPSPHLAQAPPVIAPNDITALHARIDDMFALLNRLVGEIPNGIKEAVKGIPHPAVVPFRPGMEHAHEIQAASDPMFIPSSIVPSGTEMRINPQTDETHKDVSQSIDNLKKLRRGKI
jgi:hypothetical protein